ncbi:MAG: DUF1573 domain-containing protein [Flavobacteriales bacterium]|nr:DUF1573 domain-containing protein [Flavobacteriales bacterium]
MKKIIFTLAALVICSCIFTAIAKRAENQAQNKVESTEKRAAIKWENDSRKWDFGTIERGKKVSHVFKFKNTGSAPLIIADVATSCGCTTPEYTKTPVQPGAQGQIKVNFNGQGYERFTKSITLTVNTLEGREIIYITGNITDPKEQ